MSTDVSINPDTLAELCESNQQVFVELHLRLKNIPSKQLTKIISPIVYNAENKIDCKQCANCCKVLEAGISEEELQVLAALKGVEPETFRTQFTGLEADKNVRFLSHKPCIFLDNKLCKIYSDRPAACKTFPHLHAKHFKFRLRSIFALKETCPIVYESLWQLYQKISTNDPLA